MVMPLVACAVGHTPHRAHHVSHPSPVPWSCTLLPTHFVAHALHCPHPSLPAPFITHTLRHLRCVSCHLSPMSCVMPIACAMVVHLVTCTMCRAPHRTHHVSCPLPVLWSCTSLHVLCVAPLVTHAVRRACRLCCGHAPRRARH